ncbi:hypothetical protein QBC43DRAFT_354155 [Cladorrhinum sp. PSN259]|nr:hypothetical protein QBC43DRAFT_354155 [Cladorrhinum sp. PSN259]
MNDLIDHWVAANGHNPRARAELTRMLNSPIPENEAAPVILPLDELEERMDLIRRLEALWQRKFTFFTNKEQSDYEPFNDFHIATLLRVDLAFLREQLDLESPDFIESLQAMPATIKIFATKDGKKTDPDSADDIDPDSYPAFYPRPEESSEDEKNKRKAADKFEKVDRAIRLNRTITKRKQLDRDRCIITGTANPEVCHIIPFSANVTNAARIRWRNCMLAASRLRLLSPLPFSNLASLFASGIGISDRTWNCLCLSPQIHDWWGRGYFGLKYIGQVPPFRTGKNDVAYVKVQFIWMPWMKQMTKKKEDRASLGRTVAEIKAALPEFGDPIVNGDQVMPVLPPYYGDYTGANDLPLVAISRPATGFNVQSGDVFKIPVKQRYVDMMAAALKLQWALINIFAMAGGAEALEDIDYHPPFLDADFRLPGIRAHQAAAISAYLDSYREEEDGQGEADSEEDD